MLPPDPKSVATLLIVSDDVTLTANLVDRLKTLGHDIVGQAPGLKEALAMIEQQPPQLIMLDMAVLAGLGGLEAAQPVVAKWSVPIVLLLEPTDTPKVLAARFPHSFWYLLKPIQDRELQFTMDLACQAMAAPNHDQPAISDPAMNEQHFRLLAENAGDVIFTLNMDLRYTYVSPSVFRLTGFDNSEVMEQTLDQVLAPESLSLATRAIAEELRAEEHGGADPDRTRIMELEMIRQDGSTVWTEVKCSFLRDESGQAIGIIGITRDLTERKREEELRRESEVTYHALFDNMLNGLAYCRMLFKNGQPWDFIYLAVNDAFESQTGLKNVIGRKATEIIPGLRETDPELFEIYGRVASTGQPERFEMFVEALQMWFSVSVYSSKPEHFVAVFDVITEQKRIHKALSESQARLHLCLEAAHAGTWEWNLVTNENVWSEELWALYRLEPYSVEPSFESWLLSIMPEDREMAATAVQEAAGQGRDLKIEWRVLNPDGTTHWLMSRGQPLRDDQSRVVRYLGVVIDITERVQAEIALKQSDESIRRKLQAILEPEADLGSLELSDILDPEAVQSLMDDFHQLTQIAVAMLDVNGKILAATGWQDICTKFHRVHPETSKYCLNSDIELSNGVAPGKFKLYRCKNNLWDVATPIMMGDQRIGNLYIGQFFFEDEIPDRDLFRQQAIKYGFDEQAYLQALDQVPRWSRDTVNTVMTFYTKLAQILSSLSLSNLKLTRALSEKDILFDQLQESEKNYRMLVDNASDIVWNFDPTSMTFKFFSNAGERLLGYSLQAGQNMTLDDIFFPETKKKVWAAFNTVYQGQSPTDRVRLEAEHRTKSRARLWLEINAVLQRDDSGQPVSFTGSSRDITERKRAEAALIKSEERFRKFFEDDLTGDFLTDAEGTLLDCNPAFLKLFGYQTKSEIIGQNIAVFYPEPSEQALIFDQLRVEHKLEHYQTVRKRQDGGLIIVDENIVGIYDDHGNLTEVKGYLYDITDRKKAENELLKNESRLRVIFEHSPLGMILFDTEGTIVDCNENFAELMGSTVEKLIGFNTARQSTPEMQAAIRQALAGKTAIYEDLYTSITGHKTLYLRVVFNPVNPGQDPTSVIATLEDITERKRAEEALRESESRYRLITDTLTDYIYTVYVQNNQAQYTQHSPACSVITGYTPDEFTADPYLWINIVVEEDREKLQEWVSCLHRNLDPGYIEHRLRRKDGQVIWVRDTPVLKFGPSRELISYDGLIQDITERKLAEEALRESEERFKQLFDNMADGVAIYRAVDAGLDFVFVDINRQGQQTSRIALEDVVGRRVTDVFPAVGPMGLLDIFRRVYQTGLPEQHPLTLYQDGRIEQWVENYVFKLPSGLIVALYSDTSETHKARMVKEQLQEQLSQARKMEAIGTLAGGISHDFNNLLQAITGYTQIMLLDKEDSDPDYPNLEAIQKAGERASELVRQLLLFSRKVDTARRPVALNQEIEQARRILQRTIPKMIDIEIRPGGRLWNINADPVQIEQILLNLGVNAADAMLDGGTLTIETSNIVLDADYIKINLGAKPGRYVLISVSDTGHGMDSETVAKIFEPFFTTKEIGKGTGLGLASVYGIVTGHGGYIHCYSEIGRGTTFKIYLPAIEEADSDDSKMLSPASPRGGTETILLVDDEEPIRNFASLALTRFGYKVLTASSGEAALEVYSDKGHQIDLVITDIGMPGIGGHRCLQELIRINPAVKVLIASGYSINGQIKKTLEAGAAGYVGKPYQLKELLDTVRAVLDQGSR